VANGTPLPGTSIDLALHMTPTPPWHGYWKNGGDAGFGMEVEWDLPPGVTISDFAYPVPQTLIIGGLINHVYEQPYALIARLSLAETVAVGTPLTIRGEARWLACTDEICVPESGTLTIDLVAGRGNPEPRMGGWRAALPPLLDQAARYHVDGDTLRLAIPIPASASLIQPHLFVEQPRINQPGGGQRFSRNGDMLIVEMPVGSDAANAGTWAGVLRINDVRGVSFRAEPGDVAAAGDVVATVDAATAPPGRRTTHGAFDAVFAIGPFLTALFGAIVGGLILNIMPCVFPILSLKALALARAGGEQRQVRAEGFAYTAGAVLTCAALGAALLALRAGGEALGWAFQLQRPESVVLLIALMAAITANLAGLFDFASINLGFGRAAPTDEEASPTKEAFLTGALAAFIATPCTGPFLGAALGATLTLPAWAALPVFAGLGFGLALPFLALALFPALRRRLPKPGPWMETFRRWLAVPMALTVVALVWLLGQQVGLGGWMIGVLLAVAIAGLGWWAGLRQQQGLYPSPAIFLMAVALIPAVQLLPPPQAASAPASVHGAQPWSAERLMRARADGRVFVYFTADWCVTCKVNEAATIKREDVARALGRGGVSVLVADWTNADAAITAELARHGRNSVPLYLWYPAGGGEPEILPQILTPAMLLERSAR
jgi:thiol:disulfide interchange protein